MKGGRKGWSREKLKVHSEKRKIYSRRWMERGNVIVLIVLI
jgi:hypothetical protein